MSQTILNKLVEQAITSGFDILKDMSKESMHREDWESIVAGTTSIIWELRQIKTMTSLIAMIEEDNLAVLGYDSEEGLDNLFEDAGFGSKE